MSENVTADHEREPLPLLPIAACLSAAVFVFCAWGYLTRAGAFEATALAPFLRSTGAGYLFAAVLSLILQFGAGYSAKAIGRAKNFKLQAWPRVFLWLVVIGAAFTGFSLHNALEMTGLLGAGASPMLHALMWALSAGVAVFEVATWWGDEALKSEAATRRARDADAALASVRDKTVTFSDILRLDPAGLELVQDRAFLESVRAKAMSIGSKCSHILAGRSGRAASA